MSHLTSRRRFLRASAGSTIGLFAAGGLEAAETSDGRQETPGRKPAPGAPGMVESHGVATKFWIDPSIAAWRPGPWRKVHIEYHTSRHMPRLAERFNADEFGDRLLAAHVNGATVFAKDMYGYCYFPSTHGRMHPNLSFDLLGKQVAALAEAEDPGPGLLHDDPESSTCRAASGMADCPPASSESRPPPSTEDITRGSGLLPCPGGFRERGTCADQRACLPL